MSGSITTTETASDEAFAAYGEGIKHGYMAAMHYAHEWEEQGPSADFPTAAAYVAYKFEKATA